MKNASPDNPRPSHDDILNRIKDVLESDAQIIREIQAKSEQSFRVWLENVATTIAHQFGIAVGEVKACVLDLCDIAMNSWDSVKDGYQKDSRAVEKFKGENLNGMAAIPISKVPGLQYGMEVECAFKLRRLIVSKCRGTAGSL